MNKPIIIIKASGDKEPFSEEKYKNSLRRSGADEATINRVVEKIMPDLHDNMTTQQLYKKTRKILKSKKEKKSLAGRYHLKKGIMELGPSGYPFERFIGELLKKIGYTVVVGTNLPGRCAHTHEVDVLAHKENNHVIIECKFHNRGGIKSSITTALYVKARHDDIIEKKGSNLTLNQCWLVTNTRFTSLAMEYGTCQNMVMLSWSQPAGKSLAHMIDSNGLYPITCLSSITKKIAQVLMANNIVLCCDIQQYLPFLKLLNMDQNKIDAILKESQALCSAG
jgi:hypothetical protein